LKNRQLRYETDAVRKRSWTALVDIEWRYGWHGLEGEWIEGGGEQRLFGSKRGIMFAVDGVDSMSRGGCLRSGGKGGVGR
jgi:hypothetical protein